MVLHCYTYGGGARARTNCTHVSVGWAPPTRVLTSTTNLSSAYATDTSPPAIDVLMYPAQKTACSWGFLPRATPGKLAR